MPIRINLLAEAQAAEELRRRDPVKRAILAGVLAVALMFVWSSWLQLKVMLANRNLAQAQSEIAAQTNAYQLVLSSREKTTKDRANLAALHHLSDCRFLEGTLLDALQHLKVSGVQLVRLRLNQNDTLTPAVKDKKGVVKKPAFVTENTVLYLDARDASANPGDEVNKFKDAISRQSYFQTMLDKTNGIRLATLSPPSTGPDGKPYVLFTFECHYPTQIR